MTPVLRNYVIVHSKDAQLRIPPNTDEVAALFTGWGGELATCRKFGPTARNYAAAKLMAEVGLRVNEARRLDLLLRSSKGVHESAS